MKSTLAVFALATSFAAAAAQDAVQKLPDAAGVFAELDADRDGYLSEDELHVSTSLKLDMKTADADGDGKISRAELVTVFEHGPVDKGGAAGPAGELPATAK